MKITKQNGFMMTAVIGLVSLVVFLIYTLLQPAPVSTLLPEGEGLMTLERTMCYGKCPAYVLTIHDNGVVIFEGKHFVETLTPQRTLITPEQLKTLLDEFTQVNFINQRDYVDPDSTDAPSIILSLTQAGERKQVTLYLGDEDVPQELIDLAQKIDEITNSQYWIGR